MSQQARDLSLPVAVTAVMLAMSGVQPFVLPDDVALHLRDVRGPDGVVAHVPALSVPRWVAAVAWPAAVGAVAVVVARIAARVRGRRAATEVLGLWFSVLVALLLLRGTLWWLNLQPGLSDGVRLPAVSYFSPLVAMALGFSFAWVLCARPRPLAPPPLSARLPVGAQPDRLVWSGSARLSTRVWAQWPAFALVVLPQFHLLTSWWSLPTAAVVVAMLLVGLRHRWGRTPAVPASTTEQP